MLRLHFPPDTQRKAVIYWVVTVLVAAENLLGGAWDVLRTPYVSKIMVDLHYPLYVLTIIGVWKLLGALVILVPRFPRLKEWAYAGMFFDYTGAVASHLAVGHNFFQYIAYPLLVAILVLVSWSLRPASRREPITG